MSRIKAVITRMLPVMRGAPHTLPGQLVVSLTSHPPRFNVLDLTIRTLLSQDVAADAVVLWLAGNDRQALPKRVLALEAHGLLIRSCDPDMKSANKLAPALKTYPDAFIVTADDDIHYPRGWLRRFVEEYRRPNEVLCQRGRKILPEIPYDEWPYIREEDAGVHVFPTGRDGILYPPNAVSPEVHDANQFMRLCSRADDVWFYWMIRRGGSIGRIIRSAGKPTSWPGSQGIGLWSQHNRAGGNDRQIAAMIEAYGLPA